jgi:hypothetical protein
MGAHYVSVSRLNTHHQPTTYAWLRGQCQSLMKVPLRAAATMPGERASLIAQIAMNRSVLLEAAPSAASKVVAGARCDNFRRRRPLRHLG